MRNKLYYSIDEVLAVLPVSRTRLYKAVATGDLVSVKLGRRRLISPDALQDFVDRCAQKGGGL
jgi:excisionase family DNA binding protein